MPDSTYVLITAAHNEEAFIEKAIRSILGQLAMPCKWIIVSDASTDRTEEIVTKYANENAFIELIRVGKVHRHDFAAKAHAMRAGYEYLKNLEFAFVGILDADVSLEPDYYSQLLDKFSASPRLGLSGGFIYESTGEDFSSRITNTPRSVAGAAQFFRRECFEEIGGILPLRFGGEDSCAEVMSRMNGWHVHSIAELRVFHHRPMGGASGWIRGTFRQGRMDHSLGIHPLFEIGRLMLRVKTPPFVLYAGVRLAGFCFSYITAEGRMVSPDFMKFLRQEETERIQQLFRKRVFFKQGTTAREDHDLQG